MGCYDNVVVEVWQLPCNERWHGLVFSRLSFWEIEGKKPHQSDYRLVYKTTVPAKGFDAKRTMEQLYIKSNMGERLEGFNGRTISVSDVIVFDTCGMKTAAFVDSVGFKDLTDFFE